MGHQMQYWCDICGTIQASSDDLEEFAFRRGDVNGQCEACTTCADALETYIRDQIQYKSAPA